MLGSATVAVVVVLVLVVVTQAAAFFRRRWDPAESLDTRVGGTARPAAIGVASGAVVLALLVVLYLGVMRWDWVGHQ